MKVFRIQFLIVLICQLSFAQQIKEVAFDPYVSIYKKRNPEGLKKILYIGGGDFHDDLRKASILRKLLEIENGYFVTYTEDYDVFERGVDSYDLLLINTKINKLTDTQYDGLLAAVRNGKPVLGIHAVTASFRNSGSKDRPEFYKMIGAKFDHHPKMHEFTIHLKEGNKILNENFANYAVLDELYYYSQYQEGNKVLLTASYEEETSPMAWVKTYGKGKVFYTALGHSPAVTSDSNFQKLILFAVDWLLKP